MSDSTAAIATPVNVLVHGRATPDTLRCSGWVDLSREPIVLSVPDTYGRYFALWLRDAADRVFASIGARATGTGPGAFALLGPDQHSLRLPPGLTPIRAPTRIVSIAGRIEAADSEVIARGFRLAPLSGSPAPPAGGETPGRPAALDGAERPLAHGWVQRTRDPAEDAFAAYTGTDSAHRPLSGEHRYVLRFAPEGAPPVHGFWELTAGERSIGDRHPLRLDADGALTIHLQHTPPARARLWNWLPVPAGAFQLALYLYWPRDAVWSPPPVDRRINGSRPQGLRAAGSG